MPSAASHLTFSRAKHRSRLRGFASRGYLLLREALGIDRTLRLLLGIERTAWRLAYDTAGQKYGEKFHNETNALPPTTLEEWVPAGASVLDVGCGTGRMGRLLAERIDSYLGLDLDEDSIRTAAALEHPPHVRFIVGDATALPVERFEVAMLVHVLEHIDDPVDLLRNLARLAPTLIVEVPDFHRCVLNRVRLDLGLDFSSDDDHVREYTEALLRDHLEAAGWRPLRWARSPISIAALAVTG